MELARAGRPAVGQIGVPAELVWPLVRASWAFLALKEATRLTPASRSRGKRLALLQAAVTCGHGSHLGMP